MGPETKAEPLAAELYAQLKRNARRRELVMLTAILLLTLAVVRKAE